MATSCIRFFIFGRHNWEIHGEWTTSEIELTEAQRAKIRADGRLSVSQWIPTGSGYELDSVICVTHAAVTRCLKESPWMKTVAKGLLGVLVIPVVTFAWLRFTFPYHQLALSVFSVGVSVLASYRSWQASPYEQRARKYIENQANVIWGQRNKCFSENNYETLQPQTLHHLEAEFLVKQQVIDWINRLKQLPHKTPEEKKTYVETFINSAPFSDEKVQLILRNASVSPSPLLEWHQQAMSYIENNAEIDEDDLNDQMEKPIEPFYSSKKIMGSLSEPILIHYWNIAVEAALSSSQDDQQMWKSMVKQTELLDSRPAIYHEQVTSLVKNLEDYLAGTKTKLSDPKTSLQKAVTFEDEESELTSAKIFTTGWLERAQTATPTQGSPEEYQAFLVRLAAEVNQPS